MCVTGNVDPLPTMMEDGPVERGGRNKEMLPVSGVMWEEAPESMTHSPVAGGCTDMVLKAFAKACWSHETPLQGVHGADGAGDAGSGGPGSTGAGGGKPNGPASMACGAGYPACGAE